MSKHRGALMGALDGHARCRDVQTVDSPGTVFDRTGMFLEVWNDFSAGFWKMN
jgi:hypothetical protein